MLYDISMDKDNNRRFDMGFWESFEKWEASHPAITLSVLCAIVMAGWYVCAVIE